jgi:LytS/YehU family sensor histidine kinase
VENAILHGLYKKQESGTLHIRITEHDAALVFEIEDDGIGREAAMKLRKENFPSHKSMGIKLTEERLRLINEYHRAAFEIERPGKRKRCLWYPCEDHCSLYSPEEDNGYSIRSVPLDPDSYRDG